MKRLRGFLGTFLWLRLGRWLDARGLPAAAQSCYRFAGGAGGGQAAHALTLLGRSHLSRGEPAKAMAAYRQALAADPTLVAAWCGLGACQRQAADMEAARQSYERALAIDPDSPQALTNLGEWLLVRGEFGEALAKFERALEFEPRLTEALNNRVAALYELGRFDDAEDAARRAIELAPGEAALHVNLGNVLLHTGKGRQAVGAFRRALELDPASPQAHMGLSTLLGESRRLAETLAFIEQEIALKGASAQRLAALAQAQQAKGDLRAAQDCCERVLALQPNNVSALITLAGCLSARADHRGAIDLQQRALAENPNMPGIFSNIAFASTYLPGISADELYAHHREWAERYERGAETGFAHARPGQADGDRPLRIGYVSGDFGTHPVGFLLRDVVRHHDRQAYAIHCYSMMRASDEITAAIREHADAWTDVLFISDEELAQRIHEDRIDILVDLSGHTAYNRLPVFVLKPAPVQATWIGYFHSTGLSSIDYFITDPVTTPQGCGQRFSEMPARLPHSRFCYSPPDYAPAVAPPPLLSQGHVTFGSFNRIDKLVAPVLAAWVAILAAVPGSRLLIKAGALDDEGVMDDLRRRFSDAGLAEERLILRGGSPHPAMLEEYGDIDIALDPYPFNGGMTTLEALWMGVPVVTVAGESVVARQSTSALANIGLDELIFADADAYVAGAVSLARDPERLQRLRRELRGRMANSPLCQPEQFARDLELLYRRMWRAWCDGGKLDGEIHAAPAVEMKTVLHVGCGRADRRSMPRLFQSRWREIRLDIDPEVMPDVVASMTDMSGVGSASVDAVYSSHNIEHLHPHEVPAALQEFRRVLKPDGVLVLTCPDLQSICARVAADELEDTAYVSPAGPIAPLDMLYGHRAALAQGKLAMAHKTGFTAKSLARELEEGGFGATIVARGASYDLWALAYPGVPAQARIDSERKACFPPAIGESSPGRRER